MIEIDFEPLRPETTVNQLIHLFALFSNREIQKDHARGIQSIPTITHRWQEWEALFQVSAWSAPMAIPMHGWLQSFTEEFIDHPALPVTGIKWRFLVQLYYLCNSFQGPISFAHLMQFALIYGWLQSDQADGLNVPNPAANLDTIISKQDGETTLAQVFPDHPEVIDQISQKIQAEI